MWRTHHKRQLITTQRGFSLLELMAVLFIVAIVSSAVGLSVGSVSSKQKRLDEVGKKLYAQMQYAVDESVINYQVIGLRIDQDDNQNYSYSWHSYQNKKWQQMDGILSSVSLPENIQIEMTIDDELLEDLLEASLNDEEEFNQESDETLPPSVVFYPNSDVSEFELSLLFDNDSEDEEKFTIYLDERGDLNNSMIDDAASN